MPHTHLLAFLYAYFVSSPGFTLTCRFYTDRANVFFFYKQCRTLQFGFGESSGFGLNLKYVHGRFHSLDFSISRFYAVYRSSRFDTLKMHSKHKPGGYHESTRSQNVSTPKVISLGLFFLSVSPLPQQSEWSNTVNIRIPS